MTTRRILEEASRIPEKKIIRYLRNWTGVLNFVIACLVILNIIAIIGIFF